MGGVINFRRFLLLAFTVLFVCERVCVFSCVLVYLKSTPPTIGNFGEHAKGLAAAISIHIDCGADPAAGLRIQS